MIRSCERLWEVDAGREGRLSAGDDASIERHRDVCDACRKRFDDDETLRELGRSLPVRDPSPLHTRRLRQSILRAAAAYEGAPRSKRSIKLAAFFSLGIAIFVSAAWAFEGRPPATRLPSPVAVSAPAAGATIDAGPRAVWSQAIEDHVRSRDEPDPARPSLKVASRPARRFKTPSDASEYATAVELFASGHYEEAAQRLHGFAVAHPEQIESEDAAFLEASALAHVGRSDAAGVVAERFLDRYPYSLHAADAATLAVRAARARGDCDHARVVASRAIADASARAAALGVCAER